jgi:predicted  nucleic acid-binding Zn-ribbon protein
MYPGDYIQQLRRDRDEAESELNWLRTDHHELEEKYNELKTRSIMDFVQEVWQEKKAATFKVQQAQEEINQVKKQNDKLKEQIDMWAAMNRIS